MNGGRVLLVATYVALFLLGVMLGIWTAFLVPLRLFGGVEGLALVLAFAGNFLAGWLGARGAGSAPAAAMPGLGWLLAAFLGGIKRAEGDLVVPGRIGGDPGVGRVGQLFLVVGLAGMVLAVVLAGRRPARARTRPGPDTGPAAADQPATDPASPPDPTH